MPQPKVALGSALLSPIPSNSLLAFARSYGAVQSLLAGARERALDPPIAGVVDYLRALPGALRTLGTDLTAGAARLLIDRLEQRRLSGPALIHAIGEVERGFTHELSVLRVGVIPAGAADLSEPFHGSPA